MTRRPRLADYLAFVLAAGLGLAAIVVPVALDPSVKSHHAYFLPMIGRAVEGMQAISLPLLFVAGAIAGLIGQQRFWLVGAATMAVFPPWSVIDAYLGSLPGGDDGHSLLGIEWAMYVLLSLPGVAGAWCARFLRRSFVARDERGAGG